MLRGLFSSATALQAFQTALDTSANNLANVNTTAFKRSLVSFQDLIYAGKNNQQVGSGVQVAAIDHDFSEGPFVNTGNELDLLIDGRGFFAVQLPNGSLQYTRDGALHRDNLGRLVTDAGFPIQPPVAFPADTLSIAVGTDGAISALTGSSPAVPIPIGQLQLTRFVNPLGLKSEIGNRFSLTSAAGPPILGVPGTSAFGVIRQKSLEQANVDVAGELVNLTSAQRSFQINTRAFRIADQLLQSGLSIIQ